MTSPDVEFLSLVGYYRVDPDDEREFSSVAAESVARTVGTTGCLYYIFSKDITKPGLFHLSEGWADRTALDEHLSSPGFKESVEQVGKLRVLDRQAFISQSKGRSQLFG